LNKVCDLANLIEVRFSRGYAKTVALSCYQRWRRARELMWRTGVVLNDPWWCGVRLIRQEKVRK
jgi:hypothetical protein